jgi:hypothetical protein
MSNKNNSGRWFHDINPASWGILARRGVPGAKEKSRQYSKSVEPSRKYGSTNHHLIQAVINIACHSHYALLEEYLTNMRKYGMGEGGSLYGPTGNFGYMVVATELAKLDGKEQIAKAGQEFLARAVEWMEPLAIDKPPTRIGAVLPSGERWDSRKYQGKGTGHVFLPGSRALFGHTPPGTGWYAEATATIVYQWLTNAKNRSLPIRFANYAPPSDDENTWDAWAWQVAQVAGWIPASAKKQPTLLAAAFRKNVIDLAGASPGPYRLRFGMEAVRLADGSLLHTASHKTASPKPPVNWVEYYAPTGTLRVCAPDGLRTYGSTGRGEIKSNIKQVWAWAKADDSVAFESKKYRKAKVVSHLVLPAKSNKSWVAGALNPAPTPVPPPPVPTPPTPPPPPPPPDDDDCEWWNIPCWLRKIF